MVTAVQRLRLRPETRVEHERGWLGLAETASGDVLVAGGGDAGFRGSAGELDGETVSVVEPSPAAAVTLRRVVPRLRPQPLGTASSFGFGDRLGRATPGHLRALARGTRLRPVLAQQSARELERLGRTFEQVLDAATWAVFAAGWHGGYGADADHLRTVDEVRAAGKAGFTMFTFDPSAVVDMSAGLSKGGDLDRHLAAVPWGVLEDDWRSLRRRYRLAEEIDVGRAAATFGSALAHVVALADGLPRGEVDLEVSIDEVSRPTTPFEHAFVASELRRLGLYVTAIAPRFPGSWSKGVDVSGDRAAIAAAIRSHAAVAVECGHKLSVHSGSDKLSVYPLLAGAACPLHVKTSGTSYLEALRVVASADPVLLRDALAVAAASFGEQRASYRLDEDAGLPAPPADDAELPALLDDRGARQALHVSFGALLSDPSVGLRFHACLDAEAEAYAAALERHLGRHLELLAPAA